MDVKAKNEVKEESKTNIDGLKKLCRLCATPLLVVVPLFGEYENRRSLAAIVAGFFEVEVSDDDELSTSICLACLNLVENFEKMRLSIAASQITQQDIQAGKISLEEYISTSEMKIQIMKNNRKGSIVGQIAGGKVAGINVKRPSTDSDMSERSVVIKKSRKLSTSSNNSEFYSTPDSPTQADSVKLKCRVCLQMFSVQRFENHTCDTQSLLKCNKCRMSFVSKADLDDHMKTEHKRKPKVEVANCTHCNEQFELPALEAHLLAIARKKVYVCNYCTNFFNDELSRDEHTKNMHPRNKKK